MEPHRHRFCCFFSFDCSLWVILPLTCWWYLFGTVFLHYSPSHFTLQECYHIFAVWSLPACGRLSVAWCHIVNSMTCSSWRWVFLLARTFQMLTLFVSPSNGTLVSSMYWTQRWILPPHNRSYCLGSCCAPSSCFLAKRMLSHCSLIFLCVSNICSDSFRTLSVWNGRRVFFSRLYIWLSFFLQRNSSSVSLYVFPSSDALVLKHLV